LQAEPPAGGLEVVQHGGHQPRAGRAQRVTQRNRPAARVELRGSASKCEAQANGTEAKASFTS